MSALWNERGDLERVNRNYRRFGALHLRRFSGLHAGGFAFRIVPRSARLFGAGRAGKMRLHPTSAGGLDRDLVIYSNDDGIIEAVLSAAVRADLASWPARPSETQISDIRVHDDKLLYAVTGTLGEYEEYQLRFDTACRLCDAVTAAASEFQGLNREADVPRQEE